MKALFIRPMMSEDMEKEEPLGILYLMMFLQKNIENIEIDFLDLHILRWDNRKVVDYYIDNSFDIMLISTLTISSQSAYRLIDCLKEHVNTVVIMGGPHATACPEDCLNNGVDFCCLGEGEIILTELVKAIISKGNFSSIPNIAYKINGVVVYNERKIVPFNIDQLEFPDYTLLRNFDCYHTTIHTSDNHRALPIMASRGCLNDCPFCSSKLMWNRKLRYRTPEKVYLELLSNISNYGISEYHFLDDDLLANKTFILRLTDLIVRNNMKIAYCCLTTVKSIMSLSDEELDYIKSGGLTVVEVGIESLMEKPLKYLQKTYSLDILPHFVSKVNKHDLDVRPLLMYLIPFETISGYNEASRRFKETLGRLHYLQRNWIVDEFSISRYSSCFTSLPGTKFCSEAEKLGLLIEDKTECFDTDKISFVPYSLLLDIPQKVTEQLHSRKEMQAEIESCCFIASRSTKESIIDNVWSRIDGKSSVLDILIKISNDKCAGTDGLKEYKKAIVYVIIMLAESNQIYSKVAASH